MKLRFESTQVHVIKDNDVVVSDETVFNNKNK